jgi:D-galactarolactone cycloisomerase
VDATWLEEPFARDDLDSYRRLAEEVDIPITGGEFSADLTIFRDYLTSNAVDIIQPDVFISGGIWATRKVAVLAEAFGKPCILHGTNGPDLAASLQVASTIPSCRMMEFALIFPPLTPEEMYEPLNRILKQPSLYTLKNGYVELSKAPGLGIELDEEAVEALRQD